MQDDNDDSEDGAQERAEDVAFFDAAQSQLFEEMAAAGLEGSLPMSFGSSKRHQQQSSTSRHKKRQRVHALDPQQQQTQHDAHSGNKSTATSVDRPEKLAKVHVKFDSDGEEVERVVEEVADPMASVSEDPDANASPSEELEPTTASTTTTETSSASSASPQVEPPGIYCCCLLAFVHSTDAMTIAMACNLRSRRCSAQVLEAAPPLVLQVRRRHPIGL